MLIDFHTHCFPEKIAERAINKLSDASGGIRYYTDGSANGLKESMKRENVDASIVLNIATNEHQMESVNNFAVSINNKKDIFSFGSVFPTAKNALYELERIKALGLLGVKFHPDYQGFVVDDPMMKPIYKKISELGLITVFHAGYDYGFKPPFGCMPQNMQNALKWFDSPVVAAHWGGLSCGEDVIKYLCGLDLYFDTSFGYCQMPKSTAERIIEKHGTQKMLFATDSPWHTASMEIRLLNSLNLSENEMDLICFKNAKKLLGI